MEHRKQKVAPVHVFVKRLVGITLTGMGPVAEMKTEEAKFFSSFYALYSGVAFLSVTAVFLHL
jgi:hypothetical protein